MSDTPAEKADHYEAVHMIENLPAKRVLINGLGLGMVLKAALSFDHVEHVDVVEIDQRVIDLVGPHYLKDPRVTIIHEDALKQTKKWPKGTRWDVVWSDIWPDINTDDLADHTTFGYAYGRRSQWQGSWLHDRLISRRRQERAEEARYAEWMS
jgi:spermidine synthase